MQDDASKLPSNNDQKAEATAGKHKLFMSITIVAFVVLVMVGLLVYQKQQEKFEQLSTDFERLESFSSKVNQACKGLGVATGYLSSVSWPNLQASQQMYSSDPDGKTMSFSCPIGINSKDLTTGMEVAEIDSNGYELGAEVIYFTAADRASDFADNKLNPSRYWSVPNEDLTEDAPTWQHFTSFIGSDSGGYFDAYSVKNNAVLRISLPCLPGYAKNQDQLDELAECIGESVDDGAAVNILRDFSEAIETIE